MPAGHFVAILREQWVTRKPDTTIYGVPRKPVVRVSHSLLDLLCTLLC